MGWLWIAGPLVALGTVAATTPPEEIAPEVAPPPASEILDLATERFERMTVAVSVMGQGPFRFIVDTGAQATIISHALADRLQLSERRPAMMVGLNSQRLVEVTSIPQVTLGSRTFPVEMAALIDPFHMGGADGILGLDSLQHERVLIDFREGRMAVADAAGEGRSGYEIVIRARRRLGQLIIASARIDGVRTAIIVDTGAQGSVGNPELDRRLRRARDSGSNEMTDINGIQQSGAVRIAGSLDIGRARLTNLPITFADSPTFRALGLEDEPALLLGMSELRLFNRVAIDFSTREVLFDLPTSTNWPGSDGAGRL